MRTPAGSFTGRRRFLKQSATALLGAGWAADTLRAATDPGTNAAIPAAIASVKPAELRITDVRVAVVRGAPMTAAILRLDTNQGLYGLGEVRDGASKNYALFLKSRLLGENPCNVDKLFRKLKQFGQHGRQGGGVSGVEMALWDLAGKAYQVPVYQLLGGRFRNRVRIYTDTPTSKDPKVYAERLKSRRDQGYTMLKMDLGAQLLQNIPGALTRPSGSSWPEQNQKSGPFTGMELTDKGIGLLGDYVAAAREAIGMEIPLATDHIGHIGVNSCIRLGKALEKYNLAWMEDLIPWQYTDLWKKITDAIEVPTLTGEDIYLKESFLDLCKHHAVDMIQPDLATAGGIMETKKIGDMAQDYGLPMVMHFAGTPVSFMANVHCAAATENVLALEFHSTDVPWWNDLVAGPAKPIVVQGYVKVPEAPGLGITLNDEIMKQHLAEPGYFEPTPEWDRERSVDRPWS